MRPAGRSTASRRSSATSCASRCTRCGAGRMFPWKSRSTRRWRRRRSSAGSTLPVSSTGSWVPSSERTAPPHEFSGFTHGPRRGARGGRRQASLRRGRLRGGCRPRRALRRDGRPPRRRARCPRARGGRVGGPGAASLTAVDQAAYPVELQEKVDAYLEGLRFAAEPGTARLEEAMRYSLLAGGKRIRPVLALATAEAVGRPPEDVLALAAAIEMIHTYSLIHDDLPAMDDDELRRGKPTCHVAFGEDVAILAGDGLFAEALRLALAEQPGEPANVLAAIREVVTAAGTSGMVGGQFLDVAGEESLAATHTETDPRAGGAREPTISLRHLHELKTGALIAASVGSVLALEGLDGPPTMPFRRFAAELGVVFQIVDDILDVTGDEAELGKPRGSDERHGKATYVSVFGLDRARDLAKETHASAIAAIAQAEGATGRLTQIADYILTRTT